MHTPNHKQNAANPIALALRPGRRRFLQAAMAGGVLGLTGLPAGASTYPHGPISLIVPFSAGGATDILGRVIAKAMEPPLKQTLIVENRVGAAGSVGAQAVVRAKADGQTLLMGGVGTNIVLAFTQPSRPYDPVRDLLPVVYLCNVDYVLTVAANSPYKTLDDLLKAAKTKPGEISYMSTGPKGPLHVALEYLNKRAGTSMTHVPYKGEAPAYPDLISGRIDVAVMTVPFTKPRVADGSLRVLATISAQRSAAMPDVPTVAELGFEGYAVPIWNGLFVPAETPAATMAIINDAANKALSEPQVNNDMIRLGVTPVGGTAQAYVDFLDKERMRWKQMIEITGVLQN